MVFIQATEDSTQLMGIDLDWLDNMRIRVFDKKLEPSFENMGHFLITLRPLKAGEDQPNSTVMQSAGRTEVAPMEGESACSSETCGRSRMLGDFYLYVAKQQSESSEVLRPNHCRQGDAWTKEGRKDSCYSCWR